MKDWEKELEKLADTWVVDGGLETFTGDDEMIARQNFKDDVGVLLSSQLEEVLGSLHIQNGSGNFVPILKCGNQIVGSVEIKKYNGGLRAKLNIEDYLLDKAEVSKLGS